MRPFVLPALLLPLLVMPGRAPVAQTPNPSFNVVNRAPQPIMEVYATPARADRWGRDRLGRNFIPPGQTFPVRLPADGACAYDIRIVYADGRPEERRGVDTCAVEAIVFPGGVAASSGRPGAADPSFRLINRGRVTVNDVFVSDVGNDRWGRDRLGDATVPPGAAAAIRLPSDSCRYDIRVVFETGQAFERRNIDLCAAAELRVP